MSISERISLSKENSLIIERLERSYQRKFIVRVDNPRIKLDEDIEEERFIPIITKLSYDKNTLIEINKPFKFKGEPYIPTAIERSGVPNSYFVFVDPITISSLFLLPMLGNKSNDFKFKSLLVNAYNKYSNDIEEEPHLYLCYRFEESEQYEELEKFIKAHSNYVREFHPDQYHIIYKIKVPTKYLKDYKAITNSKYSQIDNNLKIRILKFHGVDPKMTTHELYGVLYRTDKRRKDLELKLNTRIPTNAEYYQGFDTLKNTYNADRQAIIEE